MEEGTDNNYFIKLCPISSKNKLPLKKISGRHKNEKMCNTK